ncbi:MAG: hypothetical protein K8F25_10545 [Fimbriimonadaceae bacterium]|nr:hypothetical protein [Alphaproteobacteria bacterium]
MIFSVAMFICLKVNPDYCMRFDAHEAYPAVPQCEVHLSDYDHQVPANVKIAREVLKLSGAADHDFVYWTVCIPGPGA